MTKRNRPAGKRQSAFRPPIPAVSSSGVWWRAALIAAACILTYANSLSGAFILDDQGTIVENAQIREWWRLSSVLFPDPGSAASGRPLVSLSLAINYALGGLGLRGYHVWNIAVHLACALVLFGIVRRTLEWPRLHERFAGRSLNLACAVAVLWTVHPLNTEVVDYLTQRTESMMAMFYGLTLYAGIRAAGSKRPGRWESLSVLSCALGMACKESMVTAPVVVALYDRIFVFGSWKQSLRARRRVYVGLAGTWLVLAALNWSGPRSAVGGFSTGVSVWTYLLNQAVMITTYLRLVVWPRPLVVFYGWPLPLTLAGVWPHALVVVLLMVATIVGLMRVPAVAFLGAWFFMTLAPTSSILPIATEVGAERRMYVPLMAVLTLAVVGAAWLTDAASRKWPEVADVLPRRAVTVAGFLLGGVLSVWLATLSMARNREYASPLSIARTVVERRPSSVAHHILGERLALDGHHDEAITHLRQAVALGDSRAGYSLAVELFNAGKVNEAIEQFETFLRTWRLPYRLVPHWLEPLPSEVFSATMALAQAFAMQGRWPQSVEQAQRLLVMSPSNIDSRLVLADALFGAQRFSEAGFHYQEYLKSRPDDVHALINGGVTSVAADRLDEAIVMFRRAVSVDPRNANARRVLAIALMDRGDVEEAARQAREGLALRPDDPETRELLGRAEAAARGGAGARRPGR